MRSSRPKYLKVNMKKMKKIRVPMKVIQLQARDSDLLASLEAKHLTSRDTLPASESQMQDLSACLRASGSPLFHSLCGSSIFTSDVILSLHRQGIVLYY